MNSELYTKEFRNFKYLKSSPFAVSYFKRSYENLNKIQPWSQELDPKFYWPNRVEFLEQLFDLQKENIYIVDPSSFFTSNSRYKETAILTTIEKPVIYQGNLLRPEEGKRLTVDDIPLLESLEDFSGNMQDLQKDYFVCSDSYFKIKDTVSAGHPGAVVGLRYLPVIPSSRISYTAIFHNREWAEKYNADVLEYLRKYYGAISAIAAKI